MGTNGLRVKNVTGMDPICTSGDHNTIYQIIYSVKQKLKFKKFSKSFFPHKKPELLRIKKSKKSRRKLLFRLFLDVSFNLKVM